MLHLYNIRENREYGIYKYVPNIDWNAICINYNKIEDIEDPIAQLNAIQRYVHQPYDMRIIDDKQHLQISYGYISKVALDDRMYSEMDTLMGDMRTRELCAPYEGHERLVNTRSWSQIAPTLRSAGTDVQRLIFESYQYTFMSIYYINNKISEKLLEFLECVSKSIRQKLDDNTFIIDCNNQSSVLLLSGEYSKETLSQHIQRFLNVPKTFINNNFITDRIDYSVTGDVAEKQLQSLVSASINKEIIRQLVTLDKRINKFVEEYSNLLVNREHQINIVQQNINLCVDVKDLKNTLDKMSNKIKWRIASDIMNNKKTLELNVVTPLFNYDERIIKKMIDNGRIFDYFDENSWYIKLITDCFVDNTKQFMTQTIVNIGLDNYTFARCTSYNDINAYRASTHPERWMKTLRQSYMPNPHIARFNCWGQNAPVLTGLLKDRKWEEFLYCLQATLGNINFNDATVFEYFAYVLREMPNDFVMCRDVATGKDLTKSDLIKEYTTDEENKDN